MKVIDGAFTVEVRVVGNDEGDMVCSICGRKDWYAGVQFRRNLPDSESTMITEACICTDRYLGPSCAELFRLVQR